MPRVPYRDRDAVPDDIARLMDRQLADRGYVLNLYRALRIRQGCRAPSVDLAAICATAHA